MSLVTRVTEKLDPTLNQRLPGTELNRWGSNLRIRAVTCRFSGAADRGRGRLRRRAHDSAPPRANPAKGCGANLPCLVVTPVDSSGGLLLTLLTSGVASASCSALPQSS